ncbi:hypothetical protein BJ508DRAFT_306726 [Ascobolus immersus RN42]|uniref:Uncharacterized protein n=1 Tax=Ascobolus immersus RN42 TaxID=1160509 RepID=A0A3N4IHT2_ASCIM|nr:hypothetical protein BJ508DRAFT_306726 [Ascobolus immersus RN42]
MSSTFDIRCKLSSIDDWLAFQYSTGLYEPLVPESVYFSIDLPQRMLVQKVQRIAIKRGLMAFTGYPWSLAKAERFERLMAKQKWEVVGFVTAGSTWRDGVAWIWWDGRRLWNDDGSSGQLTVVGCDAEVGFEIDYEMDYTLGTLC